MRLLARVSFLLLLAPVCHASVLVLGATGRTGSLLYHELQHRGRFVQALVRNVDKAREVLHCVACDETEGIHVGDIRNLTSLLPAFLNVRSVVIATGVSGRGNETTAEIKAIEFVGVQNAVRALAQNKEQFGLDQLQVVLCSSQGTTTRMDGPFGDILFYKLNAEAFLGSVGMATSIVKPCGLVDAAGRNSTLVALHDDARTRSRTIPRADVARVMAELVIRKPQRNLRFDLCSMEGPPTTNIGELLEEAKWDWERESGGGITY